MLIKQGNWSYRDPGDDIPDGSEIQGGNFCQAVPDTEIMAGKTLTIRRGNFINVKKQPTWTILGGNWARISRCTNLHPELIAKGALECSQDCSHVVDIDEVWIDGELVDKVYHCEDKQI